MTVTKSWDDANNQDGKRPNSVKVQLYANGQKQGSEMELNADNGWSYTWTKLPKKSAGNEISYTVKETTELAAYRATVDDSDMGNIKITNSHTPKISTVRRPRTGDTNQLMIYLAVLAIALTAIVGLVGVRRRRRQ